GSYMIQLAPFLKASITDMPLRSATGPWVIRCPASQVPGADGPCWRPYWTLTCCEASESAALERTALSLSCIWVVACWTRAVPGGRTGAVTGFPDRTSRASKCSRVGRKRIFQFVVIVACLRFVCLEALPKRGQDL